MRRWAKAMTVLCCAVAAAVCGHGRPAAAGTIPCKEVYGPGGGYVCGAEVESRLMDTAYKTAQTQTGCWASSMAMIIAFYGGGISQSDILSTLFGSSVPDTLTPAQIAAYLNHTYTSSVDHSTSDTSGTALFTTPIGGSRAALKSLIAQLTDETPLLVFSSHNAMVLTAVYYHADIFSRPTSFYAAVVRDPFPLTGTPPPPSPSIKLDGHPGERFLTAADYNDIQSVYQVSVKSH
ncbi:MAG TPA: papain-like cysteine protease family protein [Candidatus Eremiobacteraceae bacterium]|nr:papain-like cysteine protease family protein [Candidatus Eremiobacteraceae bacterium]